MTLKAAVIIPAAGFGTRMQADRPKQFLLLDNTPILVHTVQSFISSSCISSIVVVVPKDHIQQTQELLNRFTLDQANLAIIPGGKRRQDSVKRGLDHLAPDTDIVLVHDGARPLIDKEVIERCYQGAIEKGAVIAAVPVKDTIKRASAERTVDSTIDRSSLWQAQTPQAMRRDLLERAYKLNGDADVTDEASLLEKAGIEVHLIHGSETNIKITRPDDLVLAQKIKSSPEQMKLRIGHGYDAHRFSPDRKLILGGVTIPHTHGLAGHSDADVLTHALCDALLGALGKGDIGRHFPDTDKSYSNIYSIKLLEKVMALVTQSGYTICNLDITVICQSPRLAPFLEEMQKLLSTICKTEKNNVNIKATTTEKMGFAGRKEGISSHAVVLLQRRSNED